MKRNFFLAALVLLIFARTEIEAQFSLGAEFRPRAEYRHGYQTLMSPEDMAAFFISQRTRLNLNHNQEFFELGLSLQDVRVWGEVPQLVRTGVNTTLHQAWAVVRLSEYTSIRAGRQEIIYDDHRIFGNVDWAQQGRSHDAAVVRWSGTNDLVVHAGFAFNQESERLTGTVYNLNNYKTFQYIWLNKSRDILQASFLFLNNGMQENAGNTAFSQTMGGRVLYLPGMFTLSGAAYMQTGRDVTGRSISAYYFSAELDHRLTGELNLQAGFELLSGTDQSDIPDPAYHKNHSFNPLYGTNHKFNGHMDYFYVGTHLNNVGLRDFYAGLLYNQGIWDAGFRVHYFASDALLIDPGAEGQTMPRYLGTEIDIYWGFNLFYRMALRFGYSHMLASRSMEVLKGGSRHEINNWAWMMLVLRPEIF